TTDIYTPRYISLLRYYPHINLQPFPTRRSSDLVRGERSQYRKRSIVARKAVVAPESCGKKLRAEIVRPAAFEITDEDAARRDSRSEEHTSELQSLRHLVCRLLLEKKKVRYVYEL